jgi:streptogramin lyase
MQILAGVSRPTQDGLPARDTVLTSPAGAVADTSGNLYFIDDGNRVRRTARDGRVTTIYRPASGGVYALAVSAQGNLFVAMSDHIVRITPGGERSFYAGEPGVSGFNGEDSSASRALFASITSMSLGADGTLYVADAGNNRIRAVYPGGGAATIAGSGECAEGERAGDALQLPLCAPSRVAAGTDGDVYALEAGRLLRIRGGVAEPFGGELSGLTEIAAASDGSVVVADSEMKLHRIQQDGTSSLLAGGFDGDLPLQEGSAGEIRFVRISGLTFDPQENLFVTDSAAHHVRRLDPYGSAEIVAGANPLGVLRGSSSAAYVSRPSSVLVDGAGTVYFGDSGNNLIRRIASGSTIDVEAGAAQTAGFARDATLLEERIGADARSHRIDIAAGSVLAFDQTGRLWFSDNRSASGTAGLFAVRNGIIDAAIDSGVPYIGGIAFAPDGTMYISDTVGHRVLRIDREGSIEPFAGTGQPGRGPDVGLATETELRSPRALMYAPDGSLYVAETGRVRRVASDGKVSTFVNENVTAMTLDRYGNVYLTTTGYVYSLRADSNSLIRYPIVLNPDTPNGRPTEVVFRELSGIAISQNGDIYVSDAGLNTVSRLLRNVPRSLSVVSGGSQTITAGQEAADLLRIRVLGSAGAGVPNVTVRFTSMPSGALTHPQTVMTDASGIASVRLRAGSRTGEASLQISVAGLMPISATATVF